MDEIQQLYKVKTSLEKKVNHNKPELQLMEQLKQENYQIQARLLITEETLKQKSMHIESLSN